MISLQPVSNSFGVLSNVTLTCGAEAMPNPTYTWFLAGEELAESTQAPMLTFTLTPEKRGEYHCVATNLLGSDQSDTAFISINGTIKI